MTVDQTERACSACGASNPAGAGFCWQCYAPFAGNPGPGSASAGRTVTPSSPAGGISHFSGAPAAAAGNDAGYARPGWARMPSPPTKVSGSRRPRGKVAAVVVSLVLGLGVYGLLHRGGVHFPDELAGSSRITTPEVKKLESNIENSSSGVFDAHPDVAVYGRDGVPQFLVAAGKGQTVETTDQLFDAYVSGLESSGGTVDAAGETSGTRDGAEYRCAAATAPIASGHCLWRDDESFGVVISLDDDLASTQELLFTARNEVL